MISEILVSLALYSYWAGHYIASLIRVEYANERLDISLQMNKVNIMSVFLKGT